MSSTNVGSIHYDLGLDTTKFDAAQKGLDSKLGAIGAMAAKTAAVIGVAITAAGGFAIKSAAEFEQTRIGIENMLGSADNARQLLSDISDFAAKTPFAFPELAGAARQLIAFGFNAEEAFDAMKQLGDVSAAVGAPVGDLAYLMGTLRTQGRAFTIDIRQFAQRGIPIYEYLAKVLGTTEQKIIEMIEAGKIGFPEVQKAFAAMTAEGGKFYGTMEKQSQSFKGRWDTLLDTIGQFGRELVGINKMGDIEEGSLFDMLGKLIDSASKLAVEVMPTLKQAIRTVIDVAEDLAGRIGNYLGPKFDDLRKIIESDVAPVVKDFYNNVLIPLATVLGTVIVVAIGFLIDAIKQVIKWFTEMSDKIEVAWGRIVEFLQPAIDWFVAYALPVLKEVWRFIEVEFKKAWEELMKTFQDLENTLKASGIEIDILTIVLVALGVALALILAPLLILTVAIVALTYVIIKVVTWLIQFDMWIRKTAGELANAIGQGVSGAIQWLTQLHLTVAQTILNIGNVFNNMKNSFYHWGANLIQGLINGIVSYWSTLINTVKAIANSVAGWFKSILGIRSPSKVFAEFGGDIVSGLVNGIESGTNMAKNTAIGLAKTVADNFNANGSLSVASSSDFAGVAQSSQPNAVSTNIYGDINIKGNDEADYFFNKIDRMQERALMGLTP